MKYCPVCSERYDDEVILFCTKDGTPLVDEKRPNFTALPSEGADQPDDDMGEETVIRRKTDPRAGEPINYDAKGHSERIVIPTTPSSEQHVRPRTAQAYNPPPPPNTAKTVVLTILGTLAVLGFGAGLFWLLQKDAPANINTNINSNVFDQNANLNTNLGFDSNFNFNTNSNFNTGNINTDFNANIRTPTPTPSPKPTATPEPSPTASPTPTPTLPSPTPRPTVDSRPPANLTPTPVGTPRTGPRPPAANQPNINGN